MLDSWPCGAMDNASAYGAEDSRFESWQGRTFSSIKIYNKIFRTSVSRKRFFLSGRFMLDRSDIGIRLDAGGRNWKNLWRSSSRLFDKYFHVAGPNGDNRR